MPNLLWFEWERDPEGYEVLELDENEIEFLNLEYFDLETGRPFIDPEFIEVVTEPDRDISAHHSENVRLIDGASEATTRLIAHLREDSFLGPSLFDDGPFFIASRSDRTRRYRPLDSHPGLFMEFSELEKAPEAVVAFASKFGLLDRSHKVEPLKRWFRVIEQVQNAVRIWDSAKITGDFAELLKEFDGSFRFEHITSVVLRQGTDDFHPAFYIAPDNLEAAIWLQLAQSISANTELRRCTWCPAWFAYGTGTGRRKSAHYCSDRCRKAAHRHKEAKK